MYSASVAFLRVRRINIEIKKNKKQGLIQTTIELRYGDITDSIQKNKTTKKVSIKQHLKEIRKRVEKLYIKH